MWVYSSFDFFSKLLSTGLIQHATTTSWRRVGRTGTRTCILPHTLALHTIPTSHITAIHALHTHWHAHTHRSRARNRGSKIDVNLTKRCDQIRWILFIVVLILLIAPITYLVCVRRWFICACVLCICVQGWFTCALVSYQNKHCMGDQGACMWEKLIFLNNWMNQTKRIITRHSPARPARIVPFRRTSTSTWPGWSVIVWSVHTK